MQISYRALYRFLCLGLFIYLYPSLALSQGSPFVLEAEVLTFFRNNEYEREILRDYTLPGYRLRSNISYSPPSKHHISLSLGLSNIYFWGSRVYPTGFAYTDLPYWSDEGYQYSRFRLTPFVQARIKPSSHLALTLGTLEQTKGFIDPLYNEELALSADDPTGVQITYEQGKTLVDAWVNWQSFIYKRAKHPEAFVFGLRATQCLTQRQTHALNLSLQSITAHRGGVHNTIPDTVHSQSNLALGLDLSIPNILGKNRCTSTTKLYGLTYLQRGGHYPSHKGWAIYLGQQYSYKPWLWAFDLFYGRDYIAPYGNPFAQAINEDRQYYNAKAWSAYLHSALAYHLLEGKNYHFGAKLGIWYHPHSTKTLSHYLSLFLKVTPHLRF